MRNQPIRPLIAMMLPLRLLIADHAPTRAGIRIALGDAVEICAEADYADEAIRAAKREQPGLCLVGREIPGDWLRAVRGIARAAPESAIVALAQQSDVSDLLEAVRAGAIGYVPGPIEADRLRSLVAAITANEAVIPRLMVRDLLMELRAGCDCDEGLTTRESQVLGLLRRGHDTAAIAQRLAIAPGTVRRHISELVHKLGVEDRAALVSPPVASHTYSGS